MSLLLLPEAYVEDAIQHAASKMEKKKEEKKTGNWGRKKMGEKMGDPNQLPVKRNHVDYTYVDSRDYRPTAQPTSIPALLLDTDQMGGLYGCYFRVAITSDSWPTGVKIGSKSDKHPKTSKEIISYGYNLDKGLIGAGPYCMHIKGRVFEEGILRSGLLRPRRYHITHFDPRYLVGTTSRSEAFVNCCYKYDNPLLQTYKLSMIQADGGESLYHGVQHLWYYKEERDGPRHYRQWTLGFRNLPIDKFAVPVERRGKYPHRADPSTVLPQMECIGKGTSVKYKHEFQDAIRQGMYRWNVVEVARYFWFGVEKTVHEFMTLSWAENKDPILKELDQYVTHIKELAIIIFAYSAAHCIGTCEFQTTKKSWAQVAATRK